MRLPHLMADWSYVAVWPAQQAVVEGEQSLREVHALPCMQ